MSAETGLSEVDLLAGQKAYLRYAVGATLINNPNSRFSHLFLGSPDDPALEAGYIVPHAENMMYEGLSDVIMHANPPGSRSKKLMENRYDAVFLSMHAIYEAAYDRLGGRLARINSSLDDYRPLPIVEENIYRAVCHSRFDKLFTLQLMDGMPVAAAFRDVVDSRRTLSAGRQTAAIA